MSTPITINLPHQHGRVEARRRIEAGFAKVVHSLPGGAGGYSERWEGDRLVFSATARGQTVSGVIDVLDTVVKMEIVLPGVRDWHELWRQSDQSVKFEYIEWLYNNVAGSPSLLYQVYMLKFPKRG